MRSATHRWRSGLAGGSMVLLLSVCGCARSPDFNVLGSYFPGWIVCLAVGLAVTGLVRWALHRWQWEAHIAALPLFYLSMALLVACVCWLLAFE